MNLIIVIDDLDPEGLRIPKNAIVYPFNMQVFFSFRMTTGLQEGIDTFETMMNFIPNRWIVKNRFP